MHTHKRGVRTVQKSRSNTIDDVASLEDGWNGYGAKKFSSELIDFVREILDCLPIQPEIFPTANDSIQLEYHKDNDSYLEFEVKSGKCVSMYLVEVSKKTMDKISVNEIIENVKRFIDDNNVLVEENRVCSHYGECASHKTACDTCIRNFKNKYKEDNFKRYIPVCKYGHKYCVNDPAYEKYWMPQKYQEWYGEIKPEEASELEDCCCSSCQDGSWYDNEDK